MEEDPEITISTKSSLILRDIEFLKRFRNLKVAISVNTLHEDFRADMDKGSSLQERLRALKELDKAGIYTVLFLSLIFPYIREWKEIVECSREFVSEYWFENLNLRGEYKYSILSYIDHHYPELINVYKDNGHLWNRYILLL